MSKMQPSRACLMSGSLTHLATLDKVVLTAGSVQPQRFLRGAAEVVNGNHLMVRSSYWLQLGSLGMLRVAVTGLDRHPPGRTILHFKVLSTLHVAKTA